MFYYRVSNILHYLSLISQSLISQSMIYRLFSMCHSGACASFFRLYGNFFFRNFSIFRSPGPARTSPGAASAHARVFFHFSEKKNFFESFPSSAVQALRARPPDAASAHARVFFDFSEKKNFFETFPSSAVRALRARPPTPPVRMREYFSTFRKKKFFSKLFHLPQSGSCAHDPRRRQCACASIFRLFRKLFFLETFPSSAVWDLRARPPAPPVRMREYFSTFRKKKFFSKLFHLPQSGPCEHVPPAPPVRVREYFSTFRKKNFFETFPSSVVRALRARPPRRRQCASRVFFDFSENFFFWKLFHLPQYGTCAHVPRRRHARARVFFDFSEKKKFSKLFHLLRSRPCAHVPPAPPVRMREYFSTFQKKFYFGNFSIFRSLGPARTFPRRRQCACATIF